MSESGYDIRESVKSLGKLVPVLKDKHGNVIDGLHRLEMFPDWPCVTVDSIDTPQKLEAARLAVNMNRRVVLSSEIDLRVQLLAKSGLKPDEIAGMTGLAKSTVYKHFPQEMKNPDKVAAGTVGGVALRVEQKPVAPVNTQKHECNYCHITNGEAKEWNGHYLCQRDFAKALDDPAKYHRYFDLLDKGKQVMRDKENQSTKPQTANQLSSWEHRCESMKVQHSQQETDLLKELAGLGLTPETDQTVPLWWTIPDGLYRDKKVCYYVHGVVHDKGKAVDRDDAIEAALKQQGWDVLVFRHGTGTVKEWAAEVKEALKF